MRKNSKKKVFFLIQQVKDIEFTTRWTARIREALAVPSTKNTPQQTLASHEAKGGSIEMTNIKVWDRNFNRN